MSSREKTQAYHGSRGQHLDGKQSTCSEQEHDFTSIEELAVVKNRALHIRNCGEQQGAPQGTILSPFLFIFYASNLSYN